MSKVDQETVRQAVIQGLGDYAGKAKEEAIDLRVAKSCTKDQPVQYAFIVGRNLRRDMIRREEAAPRAALRRSIAKMQEKIEEQRKVLASFCRVEYSQICARIVAESDGNCTTLENQLHSLELRVFEGADDERLAREFPESLSRNQRDQWKRRGLKRLLDRSMTSALREILSRRTWST